MSINSRPDLDTAVIARRYQSGESSKSIAADLRCSVRTVFLRLRAAGVPIRPQGVVKTFPGGVNPRSRTDRDDPVKRWNARNPERAARIQKAGNAVKQALAKGLLVRGDRCEECGSTEDIQAAHRDYVTDLLDVRWLCRTCHTAWDHAHPKSNILFRVRVEHADVTEAARLAREQYDALVKVYAEQSA